MTQLPAGFVLDPPSSGLPPGFQLEAPAPQAAQVPAPSWSEVPGQAVRNALPSFGHMIGGLYEAVTSPVQTAKSALDIAAGGLRAAVPEGVRNFIDRLDANPEAQQRIAQMASAAGGMIKERYGSEENIRRTLATDPVGVAGDLSMLFSGGGTLAARAPGVVGQVGGVVARVGSTIDPLLAAGRGAAKAGELGGKVLANALGVTTGTSGAAVGEAARAGLAGGERGEKFLEQMRRNAPVADIIETAQRGVEGLRAERQAAYKKGMAGVSADPTILDFTNIDSAISNALNKVQFKGLTVNQTGFDKLNEMASAIAEWKMQNPADFHTPIGMDALKQRLGAIAETIPYTERRAVAVGSEIYNAVKAEIAKQAPGYAKTMKDYEQASELLREIERTLSLNPQAQIDTSIRKLQSVLRNNVQSAYGQREMLARALEKGGAKNLFPQMAGQMMSAIPPRELYAKTLLTALLGGGALAPKLLAGIPLTSPRLVGEAAYGAGAGARYAQALGRLPFVPPAGPLARGGAAVQRYQQEQSP